MRRLISLGALGLAATFAACSGGGGSPAGSGGSHNPGGTSPQSGTREAATLTLFVPSRKKAGGSIARNGKRAPQYVSPASLGAVLTATSQTNAADNASYGYNLATSGTCVSTSGGENCTLAFPLYADTYSINVKLYDQNEDGVTNGAGSPAAPLGNELSVDTETETVALGQNNQFKNFLLHAVVNVFGTFGAVNFGATGGTAYASPNPTVTFEAVDADLYDVDAYGNATTYANGPFQGTVMQLGDTTGCSTPCVNGTNDNGTTTAGTASVNALADDLFSISYNGGGGAGTGIKASTGGAQPTGQAPYSAKVLVTGPNGPGVAKVLPLFGYPSTLALTAGTTGYAWAAQAAPPNGADQTNGSYTAYFGTPGTTTCTAEAGGTVATLGTGTYYPGYGEVYPVTPGVNGTCTLTLSDGGSPADVVTVAVVVGQPTGTITVPCSYSTLPPTGSAVVRHRATAVTNVTGPAPVLVQYAVGGGQATLPNDVAAGDTLVMIVGDGPSFPNPPSEFTQFGNASDEVGFVYTSDVTATANLGTISNGDPQSCNTAMWIGEFSGTSSAAIMAANAGSGGTSTAMTSFIVPNALNGLVITSFVSDDQAAATASSGYTEYFAYGPRSSLDVQLANTPTTDTTDPVSNTFAGVANQDGSAEIFQIPPASFVSASPPPPALRRQTTLTNVKRLWLSHHHRL